MISFSRLPPRMQAKIVFQLCPKPGLTGPCWYWTGCVNSKNYGCIGVNGKTWLTHRYAYQLLIGEIPVGLVLDHLCLNKRCCSPYHTEAVTTRENNLRASRDARNTTRCPQDHPQVAPNIILKHRRNGRIERNCRVCFIDILSRQREAKGRKRQYPKALTRRAAILAEAESNLLLRDTG